jgi:hypothetical protein
VCVASGEYRPDDGVFAVDSVITGHENIDVAGIPLGDMVKEVIVLEDLDDGELEVEWDDDDGSELELDQFECDVLAGDEMELEGDEPAAVEEPVEEPATREDAPPAPIPAVEMCDGSSQTEPNAFKKPLPFLPADIRVRPMTDNNDLDKLVTLDAFLSKCREQGMVKPPILTPSDRVRAAKQAANAWQAHYHARSEELRAQAAEALTQLQAQASEIRALRQQLVEQEQRHAAELERRQREHNDQLEEQLSIARAQERTRASQHLEAVRQWGRIQQRQAGLQHTAAMQDQQERHKDELAARSSRAETWRKKRANQLRALARARAGRDSLHSEVKEMAVEVQELAADNDALHAEVGSRIKVAEQRVYEGSRTAFTFKTILRDLFARQCVLNAGARHIRELTKLYSSMIAADGRDLKLESGSLSSVLRWEKRAEILCLIVEAQELRNALRAEPRTRLWGYCDLSPDARAIEQFGAGLEYAGITYMLMSSDLETPSPSLDGAGRLSGEAMGSHLGVALGVDGCPLVSEWTKRIFAPMLEALGPKYASTCDCWMRTLQVYGCDIEQLLAGDFEFATVEKLDVPIPLLEVQEGMTSDAGGEVQKSGGVIETVVPNSSWRHCADHCLNLSMRRSVAFERAGAIVRSISCFCRGGNRHHALVRHMEYVQQPSRVPESCEPRLRQIYIDAHEKVSPPAS